MGLSCLFVFFFKVLRIFLFSSPWILATKADIFMVAFSFEKVDKCMARLQELQYTVAGGNKVISGVSLSPRSTRGYLRTSLRCKQESLRQVLSYGFNFLFVYQLKMVVILLILVLFFVRIQMGCLCFSCLIEGSRMVQPLKGLQGESCH